jgi:hypothetical protein
MEPLGFEASALPGIEAGGARRLRAFRALDAWAVDACQAAIQVGRQEGGGLDREILAAVSRAGAALVAACACPSGGVEEREALEAARAKLLEARYQIYLARRLGLFDVRRYRGLTLRQESALREIQARYGRRRLGDLRESWRSKRRWRSSHLRAALGRAASFIPPVSLLVPRFAAGPWCCPVASMRRGVKSRHPT